jgi:hypothetical protein
MDMSVGGIDPSQKVQQTEQANKTAVEQELKNIADMKQSQKSADNKQDDKKLQSKHLEHLAQQNATTKTTHKDKGTAILSNLASDLEGLKLMDFTPKTLTKAMASNITDELERTMDKSSLSKDDKTEAQNRLTQEAVKGLQGREEKEQKEQHREDLKQSLNNPDVKDAIQDYSSSYAQYVAVSSPDAKNKLEDAQDRLKKKGFSDGDIKSLERATKRQFKTAFLSNIQNSFIEHMMSDKNTLDSVVTERQLSGAYKEAVNAGALTGMGDTEAAKNQMSNIADSSKTEIKDFIRDAVESKLIERHLNGTDNKAEIKKLVELGQKAGFNFQDFLKTWEQKKFDMGLFVMEVNNAQAADTQNKMEIGDVSAGGVSDKQSGYEMSKDEEKELLVNQLRAEMMKQALTGDPFASFSFVPKIKKLKNGLIKLGLYNEDFQKVEKEAKTLARYRTVEMLKDAFINRSTYYELNGPAYNLLNSKMKGLVANLEKLDLKLDKEQMDMIRDDANRQMHDHTIIELKSALALIENDHGNPNIEKNVPLMIKLVQRLREESGFTHGVGEDIDDIVYRYTHNVKSFKEDA